MNLSGIDWTIVAVAVIFIRLVSWSTRSSMRGVADFLSANRTAGRYLLTISGEMGNFGVISLVAGWQAFTSAGFPTLWWGLLSAPMAVIFALSGWVFYRLRETRALTVGQFLEMRYSRKLRIFAGTLCWLSGIINFGIFPAVAARFLIYFCGLPPEFTLPGIGLHFATYPALMIADLGMALFFVNSGGQISVMVTECAQGILAAFAYVAIAVAAMVLVPWHRELAALATAPPGQSMLDPFRTGQIKDFNVEFYAIGIFISIYGYQTWLGGQGFMTSARTPHEQRMGNILAPWRRTPLILMSLVLPLAAFTILHDPHSAVQAANINGILAHISNAAVRNEMTVPVTLAHLLPVGIKGLMVMSVVFLSFTCHDTYMHSWGSIFVQDVVLPWRNRPLSPAEHIRWLRGSIIFVAVFAFFFSLLYTETSKILFFQAITGAIWFGGAGAVMIGGLYSRFGTAAGAYAALIAGAVLGIVGLSIPPIWLAHTGHTFPLNGQWLSLFVCLIALSLYVGVSFATGGQRRPFNLDQMLHRGVYATEPQDHEAKSVPVSGWQVAFGMGPEFSRGDKVFAVLYAAATAIQCLVFLVVTVLHLVFNAVPDSFWNNFWLAYLLVYLGFSVPAVFWFSVGGVLDIRALLLLLKTAIRNPLDDGRVVHNPVDGVLEDTTVERHPPVSEVTL
jgi:SSS family solute:Na+ symporter